MGKVSRIIVAITTDSGGDFTTDTIPVEGRILQYRYVPDGSNPLATGADLTVVGKDTGVVVANQANIGTSAFTKAPRQALHDVDGSALLYAAAGEPVEGFIWVNEALTVTIAQGGDTDAGTLHIWVV